MPQISHWMAPNALAMVHWAQNHCAKSVCVGICRIDARCLPFVYMFDTLKRDFELWKWLWLNHTWLSEFRALRSPPRHNPQRQTAPGISPTSLRSEGGKPQPPIGLHFHSCAHCVGGAGSSTQGVAAASLSQAICTEEQHVSSVLERFLG